MTLQEANQRISEWQGLIGNINNKGFVIDQIIPVPSQEDKQMKFLEFFLSSFNLDEAILSFKDEDMEIWAIELKHYKEAGVLFYEKLS